MNLNPVLTILGWALSFLAVMMFFPLLYAFDGHQIQTSGAFLMSAIVTLFLGGGLVFASRREYTAMERRHSFIIVTLVWVVLPFFAAMPFYLSDVTPNITDAYFEALSGFTTNGASVLEDVSAMPKSILLWRALLEWFGGFSLIIMLSILATTVNDLATNSLGRAIAKSNRRRLSRRVRSAVLSVFGVYSLLSVLCIFMLWLSGMSAFEAICYSFSTISTGGFMITNGGVEIFANHLVELVLMIFMVIGALDFALHWAFFNGNRGAYFANPEYRYLVYAIVAMTLGMFAILMANTHIGVLDGLRHSIFNSVSALTTTGYTMRPTSDGAVYWPASFVYFMLLAATIGGSSGSTAGGMKLIRFILLFKLAVNEVRHLSFPRAVILLKIGKERVTTESILSTWAFFALYVFTIPFVSLGLALTGLDMESAYTLAIANIANAGSMVSLDLMAQFSEDSHFLSYFDLSNVAKVILCVAMLLGRLEFFAVLALFNPALWRR